MPAEYAYLHEEATLERLAAANYFPDMTAATLDTLQISKRLKSAGFNDDQAETVTSILSETRESNLANLATKQDLELLRRDLTQAIADAKADVFKWLVPLLVGQAALIAALVKLLKLTS